MSRSYFELAILALIAVFIAQHASAEPSAYRLSGPYTHKNLSVFLVHGADTIDTGKMLTLDEALEQKKIVVHETGNVSELAVENKSKTHAIFIQAGDIVKGGRQDRVLSYDLYLEPESDQVPIAAFCVEQGRWSKRGEEADTEFTSSKYRVNSRKLKIAAFAEKEQRQVWEEVARAQDKLSASLATPVKDPRSRSSLQLTLENNVVAAEVKDYVAALDSIVVPHEDTIGYAFAISGTMNSAEVFASHDLFGRLWKKLLNASASEALAEYNKDQTVQTVVAGKVRAFMTAAATPSAKLETIRPGQEIRFKRTAEFFFYESLHGGVSLHQSYLQR